LIKKRFEKISAVLFSSSFGNQALDPDPHPDPDSIEMLEPDPYPDWMNPDPQHMRGWQSKILLPDEILSPGGAVVSHANCPGESIHPEDPPVGRVQGQPAGNAQLWARKPLHIGCKKRTFFMSVQSSVVYPVLPFIPAPTI
jgi:hypothetical protein